MMKLNLRKFSGNIKGLAEGKGVEMSFAALWYGILVGCLLWLVLVGIGTVGVVLFTTHTVYALSGLVKLITWAVFFIVGFVTAYKAGFKGWQHGLWAGIFLGLFSVILLLEVVPTLIEWQDVLFQWVAATLLGTSGGIVGLRYLHKKRDSRGYSFKEAKKDRFRQLDRG